MIAFSWLSWIVLTLLIIVAIAGPASNGALTHFMVSMNGAEGTGKQATVMFDEEAFEYRTAPLIGRESNSTEYASAEERPAGESTEKSRLVADVD